jgi:hypothetical protein
MTDLVDLTMHLGGLMMVLKGLMTQMENINHSVETTLPSLQMTEKAMAHLEVPGKMTAEMRDEMIVPHADQTIVLQHAKMTRKLTTKQNQSLRGSKIWP